MASYIGNDFSSRLRCSFSGSASFKLGSSLLDIQRESYDTLISGDNSRLNRLFSRFFPFYNSSKEVSINFKKCYVGESKITHQFAVERGGSYVAPLFGLFEICLSNGEKREQEIYLGELPLITDSGSFVINGVERVVVSQLHRAPGIIFTHDAGKNHISGKYLFSCRFIPYRGSWLDIEFDYREALYARIDKKKKFPVTTLLLALGAVVKKKSDFKFCDFLSGKYSEDIFEDDSNDESYVNLDKSDILKMFYKTELFSLSPTNVVAESDLSSLSNVVAHCDIGHIKSSAVISDADLAAIDRASCQDEILLGSVIAKDLFDPSSGEVLYFAGDLITTDVLEKLRSISYFGSFEVILKPLVDFFSYIISSVRSEKNNSTYDALCDIYSIARPGDTASPDSAIEMFKGLFFDLGKYDLSEVGRVKINASVGSDSDKDHSVLSIQDIFLALRKLIHVKLGNEEIDDIDSLHFRRLRSIGEFLENQCYIGLSKIERSIVDSLNASDPDVVMCSDIIPIALFDSVFRDFFLSNPMSQFMDQTNTLSGISHARRLSALGHGGLSRERASFFVRRVSESHYGRVCPVETPEGQNIGLIVSLSQFARANHYGFIETPYYVVENCKISDKIVYLQSDQEINHVIAQANDRKGDLVSTDESLLARINGDYCSVSPEQVTLIEVSSSQVCSPAAGLIPFLEHDDSNRALMGSNMQRQAVPLSARQAPLVGTGVEAVIANDSGSVLLAKRSGKVVHVSSLKVIVEVANSLDIDVYNLVKFKKSNAGTCINQRPVVKEGQYIQKGQIISDAASIEGGELALGRNVDVAFLSFFGRNFEDSIVVSDRLADKFLSVHFVELVCKVSDAKNGTGFEEIIHDVPNASMHKLANLDQFGIIKVGSKVSEGDILVGKISYISGREMTPEEKILFAMFGRDARDGKDSSLYAPIGVKDATVVDVQILSKSKSVDDDIEFVMREKIENAQADFYDRRKYLLSSLRSRLRDIFKDNNIVVKIDSKEVSFEELLIANSFDRVSFSGDSKLVESAKILISEYNARIKKYMESLNRIKNDILMGDELQSGSNKVVKILLAVNRTLKRGDKMAGRHGNKGVVSCVLPIEDMPFDENGEPVDLVLTPIGLPSRMNVGQVMETVLGRAMSLLGRKIKSMLEVIADNISNSADINHNIQDLRDLLSKIYTKDVIADGHKVEDFDIHSMSDYELVKFATTLTEGVFISSPIFAGISDQKINELMELAGIDSSGKVDLYDGRTGEKFDRKVTRGVIYFLKLHHLVDDKLHARSIGPYSLVTQQPLGGKAQFGGQRFGEMEVWALEAYGAAYILREMLTVKSDAVDDRTMAFLDLSNGVQSSLEKWSTGELASQNVLIKEMNSLALNVRWVKNESSNLSSLIGGSDE